MASAVVSLPPQAFLDALPDALVVVDATGIVAAVNAAAERLFARPAHDLVGRSVDDLVPTRLRAKHAAHRASFEREAAGSYAMREGRPLVALRADGVEVRVTIHLAPMRTHDGVLTLASLREVRPIEEALAESERRFQALVQSSGDFVQLVDGTGTVTWASSACERILGYRPSELEGRSGVELLHPDDLPRTWPRMKALALAPNGSYEIAEVRVRHARGEWRWLEVVVTNLLHDPAVRAMVVNNRDITDRKRAEELLRASEERLAITLNSIADAVIATDAAGRVTMMNPVAEALTGWRAAEAIGRPLDDVVELLARGTNERVPSPVARVLADGAVTALDHPDLRARDGARRSIADGAAPIRDRSGAVVGVVLVLRDLTERRQLEARLALSDRLAAVGTLAAGVAHEINNPLAYVLANLEVATAELRELRDDALAPAPQQLDDLVEALDEAHEGAQRVRRIVRDLGTFARGAGEAYGAVSLHRVIDAALDMAANPIRHRARLVKDYGPVPEVRGSEARLGQVFLNLILNAVQAIPEGRADSNELRVVTRTGEDGRAIVEVRDTCGGMTADVRRHAFDPFFTTKPIGEGTGLGLSICHGIVRDHGGEIALETELGRGTVARVVLPPG